ncbi:X-box-binding protein 1-like [Mercenaria mercenaria]|uniref:X-box-binding protein 1-like n=1 Tax=Mercenaria mercenaria TaxID=6596 RepID=UPI00234E3E88|nr:X-box-binding protein 1-like [Mercenaria mercenaria]
MTTLQPQTIVIKTLPAKTPTTLTVTSQLEHDMLDDLYGDDGPRKRRRLTHLSQEEKLLRRKLKNRVAAQTARDRKKNFMSELEQKVAELERENKKLQQENKALKSESGTLQKQNQQLKGRLCELGCGSVKTEVVPGSAASAGLQQQGQIPPVSYWTNTYTASMLTLSLTLLLASSQPSISRKSPTKVLSPRLRSHPYLDLPETMATQKKRAWWGPHQQSWNPSKN